MVGKRARLALCMLATLALAFAVPVGSALADTPGSASTATAAGTLAAGTFNGNTLATQNELATQDALAVQATAKSGWQNTSAGKVFYYKGEKVTGLQKIGNSYYYFWPTGVLSTTNVEVGGATFYIRDTGKIYGAKYGDRYYYANLKPMTDADNFDFDTYIWAGAIVDSITDPGDSKADKLWEAFCWVRDKSYAIHQDFSPYQENWPAVYARYHFANQGGDCHSDGAAFAYLAAAIGYPAYVYIDSMGSGYAPSHCWTMIDGAVYDPLFYEAKSPSYYGAWGTYQNNTDLPNWRVPLYSASNNSGAAVAQELLDAGSIGLKYVNGKYYYLENGAKVRNAWRTLDGKRYYFTASGAAATYVKKIGSAYYVFSETGVLQTSSTAGTRIVTVGKYQFQVAQSGKAVAGWSKDGKYLSHTNGLLFKNAWATIGGKHYYFQADGTRATLSTKIGGKYYVFDKAGVLQMGKKGKKATLVTVGKDTYRVDASGVAVKGWSYNAKGEKAQLFDKTGLMLKGIWFTGGKFYAFSSKGAYSQKATKQLNKAIKGLKKNEASASSLRRALNAAHAKLKSEVYSPSCDIKGDDGLWEYDRFAVMTARSSEVNALYKEKGYKTIEDLISAEDAGTVADDAPFEYVRSITAL